MASILKKKESLKLFAFQLIAHIGLGYLIFTASWANLGLAFLIYCILACFGITMTYHRLLAHKSWAAPEWFRKVGTLIAVWGIVGSPIGWVLIHRAHHRYTDKDKDPHSPHAHKWWYVQWFSMFQVPSMRGVGDLQRDKFLVFLHKYYFHIHGIILVTLLVISPIFAVTFYLAPAAILWNMGSLVNNLCHIYGYRNFVTRDHSTCNLILGYFVFGEGWHNNHHHSPNSPKYGLRWWEIDIGYFFIRILKK